MPYPPEGWILGNPSIILYETKRERSKENRRFSLRIDPLFFQTDREENKK